MSAHGVETHEVEEEREKRGVALGFENGFNYVLALGLLELVGGRSIHCSATARCFLVLGEGLVHANTSIKGPRHSDAVGSVCWFISRRICHAPRRAGGYRSRLWQDCLNSAMPSSRTPQGCPQVYGSACARIYCLPALSLRSGLPKPF